MLEKSAQNIIVAKIPVTTVLIILFFMAGCLKKNFIINEPIKGLIIILPLHCVQLFGQHWLFINICPGKYLNFLQYIQIS